MSSGQVDRHRILILIKGLGLGGAERLIADAAPFWDRSRFDYAVAYVLPWKDQLVADIVGQGVEVTCVGGKRGTDLGTPRRFRDLVARWKPDLVHAHLPSAGVIARLFSPVPVVYTEHNLAESYRPTVRRMNRATYKRNRAVIAVSDPVADSLATYPGPTPKVIPNGITVERPDDADAVRTELGLGPAVPLVVHVGNIRPHKGHSNLIAATRLISAEHPEVVVVSIGGEKRDGDLERVQKEAEAAGLGDSIRFLGRRDDARKFLAAADVVVNPSDVEGLPVALLEALLFSRRVVATDVGGVSQVVIDEQTGLLVSPGDPEALANGVLRALESPRANQWAEAGRGLVLDRHSMTSMIFAYESVYTEILDD